MATRLVDQQHRMVEVPEIIIAKRKHVVMRDQIVTSSLRNCGLPMEIVIAGLPEAVRRSVLRRRRGVQRLLELSGSRSGSQRLSGSRSWSQRLLELSGSRSGSQRLRRLPKSPMGPPELDTKTVSGSRTAASNHTHL